MDFIPCRALQALLQWLDGQPVKPGPCDKRLLPLAYSSRFLDIPFCQIYALGFRYSAVIMTSVDVLKNKIANQRAKIYIKPFAPTRLRPTLVPMNVLSVIVDSELWCIVQRDF